MNAPSPPVPRNIVDIALGSRFETLVEAFRAAGLLEQMKTQGPFTLFAPTDDAFARLAEEKRQALFEPRHRDRLTAVLCYHVVPQRITSKQIAFMDGVQTLHGAELAISTQVRTVQVNSAMVTTADIEAANGIVHAIDAVLLPPAP